MHKKLKVLVLMGGKSPEHEISLISGREVVANLSPSKYEILPLVISKKGDKWLLTSKEIILKLTNVLDLKGTSKEISLSTYEVVSSLGDKIKESDVVFIAMHGVFGEDGTIQGMLETVGLKYTGSGVLASALGVDKLVFRKLMQRVNVPIPKYVALSKGEKITNLRTRLGDYPYFVKPHNQGSSVGTSLVRKQKDLKSSLERAFKYSNTVLIDEFVQGKEVTCGILGNNMPFALPLVEIHPLIGKYFDYDSKYKESGAEELVPANITKKLTQKVKDLAIKVYNEIGCRASKQSPRLSLHHCHPYLSHSLRGKITIFQLYQYNFPRTYSVALYLSCYNMSPEMQD